MNNSDFWDFTPDLASKMFKYWKEFLKADKEEREALVELHAKSDMKPNKEQPISSDPHQPSESCSQRESESDVESLPESIDELSNPDSIDKIALGITKVPGYSDYVRLHPISPYAESSSSQAYVKSQPGSSPRPHPISSDSKVPMLDPYQHWCHGNWAKEREGKNPRKWGRSEKNK